MDLALSRRGECTRKKGRTAAECQQIAEALGISWYVCRWCGKCHLTSHPKLTPPPNPPIGPQRPRRRRKVRAWAKERERWLRNMEKRGGTNG